MSPNVRIVYIQHPIPTFFVRGDNVGYAKPDGSFTPGLSTWERAYAAAFPSRGAAASWALDQGFTVLPGQQE